MSTSPPQAGNRLAGRYFLVGTIAEGGMGSVFAARDEETGTAVAIKFLHSEFSLDPVMRRRFAREAQILRTLDHPNLVPTRDSGSWNGLDYTVFDLVEGRTLATRLHDSGTLSLPETVGLVVPIASALDTAHEFGIIHGDIKPANLILRSSDLAPILVDFGSAKIHGLDRLTRTGEAAGTPAYLAPEVFVGDAAIGARSDIYALGLVAYECIEGAPAFADKHPGKLLASIAKGAFRPFSGSGIPAKTQAVLSHAFARKASDRFESAGAFAAAFAETIPNST